MPSGGRLSQSDAAWQTGLCRVMDPKMSCPQTLQISLFFDGTNNNDAQDNFWRDSKTSAHTNVARLFNAAVDDKERGIYPFYIPGVGTPFPQIGEPLYTTKGKALAAGFDQRCVWAYTRVLNAVYSSIASDKSSPLIWDDPEAKQLCNVGADGSMQGFTQYLQRLGVAHKQAVDEGAWPRTIKQIWINVIGFSRGAAGARAFVHKLINEWAPNGTLGNLTGKYALPYQVNFMGLLDTVASVGLPDSTRAAGNFRFFDGHSHFASDGGLDIPVQVRACVHAFSIHEQRMSFPLDSIRKGDSYPGDCRREIAYPGVHSDVGGGYAPGVQGKGCGDKGTGDDSRKLSQIPLHDMYIAALTYGVPLMLGSAILQTPGLVDDFALHPDTIAAYNGWLKTAGSITRIEDALKFGMGQMLSWRTLRAKLGVDYMTAQRFFKNAQEDALTPHQATEGVDNAMTTDPQLSRLNAQRVRALQNRAHAQTSARYPDNVPGVQAADQEIAGIDENIRRRTEAICGEVVHPDAVAGPLPNSARPGEEAADVVTNDKTDLRQGAEEMRLLLGYLYPEQRELWEVRATVPASSPPGDFSSAPVPVLSVRHEQPRSDSPQVRLVDISPILIHSVRTTFLLAYAVGDDIVIKPIAEAASFLKEHTSPDAVRRLRTSAKEAIELFDNYVHDSRCWFRVPYFHEYAPGGYFWPRVVFAGESVRLPWLGFDALAVALNEIESDEPALA